ncbi:MAG TPA: exopolysaccharide biosynthesis polyprenyl glycosylphosphotransferase [Brevundimonas sp.]|uniref:exopolysaccharide biosynthesis polyprenyl glycosylphosphotransferase n=1 Tax=Brevundimonas sp. TaxID=1871086 RepID=UPI002E0FBED4|nr:exopolysaccharide biosynthesis polyprenyl glycosylphosphotransferase [Brevundimonas sp.]
MPASSSRAASAAPAAKASARPRRQPGGARRRGPFRPELWRNAREREGVRLAPHAFRLVDVLVLWGVSLALLADRAPSLAAAPFGLAAPLAAATVTSLALLKALDAYAYHRPRAVHLHLGLAAAAALAGGAATWALAALLGTGAPDTAPSGLAAAWTVSAGLALGATHLLYAGLAERWRQGGLLTPSVVIVGATRDAEALIQRAVQTRDLAVLGVFDDRADRAPEAVAGVPVLGGSDALLSHRLAAHVDRIVIAVPASAQGRLRELVGKLSGLPTEVTLLLDPRVSRDLDSAYARLAVPAFAPLTPPDPARRAFVKRLQDLVIASTALVLLSPLLAAVALAVRLDSPGPIFFRQRRHGFNQEEFRVWKFRSMRQEAADATAARQVTADDDRVTRVGRFIRATSLDELPQLLNVLSGEMSLVGPRPHAVGMKTGDTESARLVADYARRHRLKPGLTGWAAIQGSRGPLHTAEEVQRRVKLDIEYIERQSFWLDLRIMALTLPVLLGDRLAVR